MAAGEPIFRRAHPGERARLEDLQWRSSLTDAAYRQSLLEDRDIVQLPVEHILGGGTLVCEVDGDPVGFTVVLPAANGTPELDGLFVEPNRFGSGLGRRLVAEAKRIAAARGLGTLTVVAAPEAVAFYRKCGFEFVRETETLLGPALFMAAATDGPTSDNPL